MRELIFLHGRSQQFKDAADLKQQWLQALHIGLANAGTSLDIPDELIRFPYYGDALHHLSTDSPGAWPDVIIKGDPSEEEREFMVAVIAEAMEKFSISDSDIAAELPAVIEKGKGKDWLDSRWIAVLRAIDKKAPGLASAILERVTYDVYCYIHNIGVQIIIDNGVRKAFTPEVECVIVAHSLGTVIAYSLLRREAETHNWKVPSLITLGSPLAVGPIFESLRPVGRPYGVEDWFNAFDPLDVVALHPLDGDHFPINPAITNFGEIRNTTPGRHGITGYLGNPTVALRIRDALLR